MRARRWAPQAIGFSTLITSTIQAAGSDTTIGSAPAFTATGNNSILTTGTLDAALNGGTSVTVSTGAGGAQAGNIVVASPVSESYGGTVGLTLTAYGSITTNAAANITSNGGPLNVVLDANNTGSGGYISLSSNITTNGGNIAMGGGALSGGLPTGAAVGLSTNGNQYGIYLATGDTINAGGGNITMTGVGGTFAGSADHGIYTIGTIETSGNGAITLTGTGGTASGSNYGIAVQTAGIIQTSGTGAITLTGIGGGAGTNSNNYGTYVAGTVQSTATNGGGLTLIGYGGDNGGSGNSNFGTYINRGTVSSLDGSILIDGNIGITGQPVTTATGASNYGVDLAAGMVQTSGTGAISINGIGGGTGASGSDIGTYISVGTVKSTAAAGGGITLIGYSGDNGGSGGGNFGTYINAGTVTSVDGNILIDGNTGKSGQAVTTTTGNSNHGIYVNPGVISSSGNATITLNGIGGGSGIQRERLRRRYHHRRYPDKQHHRRYQHHRHGRKHYRRHR